MMTVAFRLQEHHGPAHSENNYREWTGGMCVPELLTAIAARAALSRGKPMLCSSCTMWRCA